MTITKQIKQRLKNKATKSSCTYKISAIGFSKKGNILGTANNRFKFTSYGGGIHAERELMEKFGSKIQSIIICRVNKNGEILPIEPCKICQKIADKLGIKIISLEK